MELDATGRRRSWHSWDVCRNHIFRFPVSRSYYCESASHEQYCIGECCKRVDEMGAEHCAGFSKYSNSDLCQDRFAEENDEMIANATWCRNHPTPDTFDKDFNNVRRSLSDVVSSGIFGSGIIPETHNIRLLIWILIPPLLPSFYSFGGTDSHEENRCRYG
jgi:hypothetical protein